MLDYDPVMRPSISEVVHHPWFDLEFDRKKAKKNIYKKWKKKAVELFEKDPRYAD